MKTLVMLLLLCSSVFSQVSNFRTLPHIRTTENHTEDGVAINKNGTLLVNASAPTFQMALVFPGGITPIRLQRSYYVGGSITNRGAISGMAQIYGGLQGFIRLRDGTLTTFMYRDYAVQGPVLVNDSLHRVVNVMRRADDKFIALFKTPTKSGIIEYPGAQRTFVSAINNSDNVVGQWSDGMTHGFLFSNGEYQAIDVPGAIATVPKGLGNNGWITGLFMNQDLSQHAFVLKEGQFIKFDYPVDPGVKLLWTSANGINENGILVGTYIIENPSTDSGLEKFVFVAQVQ